MTEIIEELKKAKKHAEKSLFTVDYAGNHGPMDKTYKDALNRVLNREIALIDRLDKSVFMSCVLKKQRDSIVKSSNVQMAINLLDEKVTDRVSEFKL